MSNSRKPTLATKKMKAALCYFLKHYGLPSDYSDREYEFISQNIFAWSHGSVIDVGTGPMAAYYYEMLPPAVKEIEFCDPVAESILISGCALTLVNKKAKYKVTQNSFGSLSKSIKRRKTPNTLILAFSLGCIQTRPELNKALLLISELLSKGSRVIVFGTNGKAKNTQLKELASGGDFQAYKQAIERFHEDIIYCDSLNVKESSFGYTQVFCLCFQRNKQNELTP